MKESSFENKMFTVRQCFLFFSLYQRNKTNNFKVDHVVFGLEVSIHQIKEKSSEYHKNILGSSTSILK